MDSQRNDRAKARYHINRAMIAQAQGDMVLLQQHAEQVMGIASQWSEGPAYRLMLQAFLAGAVREHDRCVNLLRQTCEEMNEQGNVRGEAYALQQLGRATADPRVSLDYARRSLRRFETCDDQIGISHSCLNVAALYIQTGQYSEGREFLMRTLHIMSSTGDLYGRAIAMLNMASSYINQGNYHEGLVSATECVSLLEELCIENPSSAVRYVWQTNGWERVHSSCTAMQATAYNNLGNVLAYLGDLDSALIKYMRGLEMMREVGDITGEAIILNQIGDLYREKGDPVRAEEHFRASLALFEISGTRGYMYGVVLQGIGESCVPQGRIGEALEHYDAARREFKNVAHIMGEAEMLILRGGLLISTGEYSEAIATLLEGLRLAQSISAMELVVRCNRVLGTAYMYTNSAQAREYLLRALLLAEKHSMKIERKNIHNELASYYELISDTTESLSHFKKFHNLQQEIFNDNADRRMKNFEILHRVEQYKKSLAEMTAKVQKIEAELEEKTRELAELAERIMEKQEFVKLVENGLNKLLAAQPERKDVLARDLLESIKAAGDTRRDWDELTRKFLLLHQGFAERLLQVAPTMTVAELKICVLLRLDMESKGIADVLQVAVKTVRNHRQNIREKLPLEEGGNLKKYLMLLDTSDEDAATNNSK